MNASRSALIVSALVAAIPCPVVYRIRYRDIDRAELEARSLPIPLKDQLCFTTYATSMAITRTYKPMLDALGLTYPQYLVLCVLGEQDGETVGGIARRLLLESSTVTPPIKRMERARLVRRVRSGADERRVEVWLTETGRDCLARSACLGAALISQSDMTADAFAALNAQMHVLLAALAKSERP